MMNVQRRPAQRCPICRALQPLESTRCSDCGAALNGIPVNAPLPASRLQGRGTAKGRGKLPPLEAPVGSTWDEGELDLHEGSLPTLPVRSLVFGLAFVAVLLIGSVMLAAQAGVITLNPTPTPEPTSTPTTVSIISAANSTMQPTVPPTNTKAPVPSIVPTLDLPTVTPAPPTPTITPTKGPCIQKAEKGDTLYGMAARCGHKHLSIVDVIIANNALKDANSLLEGQSIEIPWPTPDGAPNSDGQADTNVSADSGAGGIIEPTLPPGVRWYTVKSGDTAISVAYEAGMTMKSLRDLNPEIQFLQCDFSMPSGGPSCTLKPLLAENQRIRVAAPTPTPTSTFTPSGNETSTPTGTATFNAPYSQSPDNNMLYESSELPTLRWVSSGQLDAIQVYMITVKDITKGITFNATTRELSFQLPPEWQPADGKPHKFEWSIAVANPNESGTPVPSLLATEVRMFTWHSK